MVRSWVQWLVNHDLKIIVYVCWFLVLPLYLLYYIPSCIKSAKEDALCELESIKSLRKERT